MTQTISSSQAPKPSVDDIVGNKMSDDAITPAADNKHGSTLSSIIDSKKRALNLDSFSVLPDLNNVESAVAATTPEPHHRNPYIQAYQLIMSHQSRKVGSC